MSRVGLSTTPPINQLTNQPINQTTNTHSKLKNDKQIIVSDARPLAQYKWGADCDAYVLVDEPTLNVKLEQMPCGACETVHFHQRSQQFFYVLAGEASMEIAGKALQLRKSEGVLVEAGARHRICNHGTEPLRFVVTSQPAVGQDRVELNRN